MDVLKTPKEKRNRRVAEELKKATVDANTAMRRLSRERICRIIMKRD
jgi:hypothetical protein